MQARGGSERELYEEFARLNPDIHDTTHMRSWFRDQVLHPHETQHTFEEIQPLLAEGGFEIEATSFNHYKRMLPSGTLIGLERQCAQMSYKALRKGRFFPGFFVVWARRR
jgi:hypothetical protein